MRKREILAHVVKVWYLWAIDNMILYNEGVEPPQAEELPDLLIFSATNNTSVLTYKSHKTTTIDKSLPP